MIGFMLALFVFLASCSKDPTTLTDSLAGLYKGHCYRKTSDFVIPPGVWTITVDTFDFEFQLISISDDTNQIFFDADRVFGDWLYREFHNRINGITDSLVFSGDVSQQIFYDVIVYPETEKITFREDGRYQMGPDYWQVDCECLMR